MTFQFFLAFYFPVELKKGWHNNHLTSIEFGECDLNLPINFENKKMCLI